MVYTIILLLIILGAIAYVVLQQRDKQRREQAESTASRAEREARRAQDQVDVAQMPEEPRSQPPPAKHGPAWIVMLLKRTRIIDADRCMRAAERAFGTSADQVHVETIANEADYLVTIGEKRYKIQHRPKQFKAPTGVKMPAELPDHKACLSVGTTSDIPPEVAYPLIGKLVVELSGRDPSHVIVPGTDILVEYDDGAKAALRADKPLQVLKSGSAMGGSVSSVAGLAVVDDKRRAASQEEAQRRLGEFAGAFGVRNPAQKFTACVHLTDGEHHEYLWVEVTQIRDNQLYGKVESAPAVMKRPRVGEIVRVKASEVCDWLIVDGKNRTGGFSLGKQKQSRPNFDLEDTNVASNDDQPRRRSLDVDLQ